MNRAHAARAGLFFLTIGILLTGCGSSGSTPTAGPADPPPGPGTTIQGIATPSSVAVVTATNAD